MTSLLFDPFVVDKEGFVSGTVKPENGGFAGSGTDVFKDPKATGFISIAIPPPILVPTKPILDPLQQTTDQPKAAEDLSGIAPVTKEFTESAKGEGMEKVQDFLTRAWESFRALDTGTKIIVVGIAILILRRL